MSVTNCFRLAAVGFLSVGLMGGLSAGVANGASGQEDTLEWLDDYEQAFALAKKTGQPVFVEFRCAP